MAMDGRLDGVAKIDLVVQLEDQNGEGDEEFMLDFKKQKINISPKNRNSNLVYNLQQSEEEEVEAAGTSKQIHDNYHYDKPDSYAFCFSNR